MFWQKYPVFWYVLSWQRVSFWKTCKSISLGGIRVNKQLLPFQSIIHIWCSFVNIMRKHWKLYSSLLYKIFSSHKTSFSSIECTNSQQSNWMEAGEKRKITKRSTNLRNFHFMRMWIASIYISCLLFFHAFHMSILNSGEMVRISLKERSIKKEVENDYPLLTDFMKYEKREYSRYVEKSRFLHHLQDEKELSFHTFNNTFIPPTKCSTPEGNSNSMSLY